MENSKRSLGRPVFQNVFHPRSSKSTSVAAVILIQYVPGSSFVLCDIYHTNARRTADDIGNAMFQSYLSKLFKKETG